MSPCFANIKWKSSSVILGKSEYLFCFNEKCMSGKITRIKNLRIKDEYEIQVVFIEPDFFKKEALAGSSFTIREASKILAAGKVLG